ncbi:MAG: 50S ribosomal protein L32 [Candidatus Pacearchaeota archaeon]|jgi:ribosomal protein L32|nr:50S ribosomal protein L32 [Clostridia bacterium]
MENDKLKFEKEYHFITDYSKPAPVIESISFDTETSDNVVFVHGNPKYESTLMKWLMKQLEKQSKIPKDRNSIECPNCGQMMVSGLVCEKCGYQN